MMEPKITRRTIANLTAKAFDTNLDALCGQSRSPRHCKARYAIWLLTRELFPSVSLSILGSIVGGKDHSTVLHGLARATHFLETDRDFGKQVERARKLIAEWRPGAAPAAEPIRSLVPVTPRRETPPAVVSEAPKLISQFGDYETWLRQTCEGSEARFLDIASREFPHLVRVPQREAAE
jgi:hypothetical protein